MNYLAELDAADEAYNNVQMCNEMQLVLFPPRDGADSDIDDAPSDDEGTCSFKDIGKGVLRQPMEVICISNNNDKTEVALNPKDLSPNNKEEGNEGDDMSNEEDDIPLATVFKRELMDKRIKANVKKRIWVTKDLERTERKKLCITPAPEYVQEIQHQNLQPVDVFKKFFDEEFIQLICEEARKYAVFKGYHDLHISSEEMYKYFAILLVSGYCKVPSRRLYWETKADTYNSLVSNSMSRNRFELIHRYLHFNDNTKIDPTNKVYKVQPLIDQVNRVSQMCFQPLGSSFSLDEAMEPYYGHHSIKQFIKGKPIRYGFKFWCLTTSEGYLLRFNPYCGSGDKIEGKTLGSSVTEKLCLNYLPAGSTVFLDNYFNSLVLLHTLRAHNINCIGTIRADRVEKAPLKELKKIERGSSHAIKDISNDICLIRWHDNNQVTIATNLQDETVILSKGTCKRWSKKERGYIQIDQPTLIDLYNQGMGGVDMFDKMRGLYRIRIRSRKWYWPFVRFCLNGAVVNMWMLYRHTQPKLGLLDFIRRITLSILTAPPQLSGPKPKIPKNVLQEVRYDRTDHFVDSNPTQRRCGYCGKCTKFICTKCNVGLHPDRCFRMYHT